MRLGEGRDVLEQQGAAHVDLARVLELAGRADEARAELERALLLFERKGAVARCERVRERLAAVRPAPA